jgi:NAD(P)-dependent dehydrogenase (short-subunit alcohol dehydrogenase family)
MTNSASGRTVAITGAASGIGEAAAKRLLEAGWTVFGLDLSAERLEAVAAGFGGARDRFRPVVCDVASATRVVAAFAEIGFVTPSLDALICCAGVLRAGPIEDMTIEDYDLVMNVNARGTFLCAQQALPLLRTGASPDNPSRVILLSSVAALRPKISSSVYSMSKAAVSQLCGIMAAEWAPQGVLVNALAPGTVDTPMVRAMNDPSKAKGYRTSGTSPLGRIAQADDVVDVMTFLLSDTARYVTGTTIPVDGGTRAAFIPPGSNT